MLSLNGATLDKHLLLLLLQLSLSLLLLLFFPDAFFSLSESSDYAFPTCSTAVRLLLFFFNVAKVSLIFFMLGMAPVYDVLPPCKHYSEVHTTAQSLAQWLNLCSGMVDGRTMWAWPSVDLYLIHKEDIKSNLLCCCPEFQCLNSKFNPFTQRT